MGLLDWLFRGPTLKDVADKVVQSLCRRGAEDIQVNLPMAEIKARMPGDSPVRIYLGNLFADYQRSPRRERAGLLERFLDGIATPDTGIPASYADAAPRLMPVVRNASDMGIAALTAARSPSDKPYSGPAHRTLAADVIVALVCDMPTAMAYVTEQQLVDWQVSFDAALEQALLNLRDLPEATGWKEIAPGVWLGEWGDSYDSSRLLLPDLIHRLSVPEPVALAPFRNALLVTSARNEAGVQLMATIVDRVLADNPRWLSFEPLRLDGQHWVPHELTPAEREPFRVLNERNHEAVYASQKQLLDDLYQTNKTDVFVASYQLMQREDGPLRSMAVWTQGVDTLLPPTELIAFVMPGEGDESTHWLCAWADVQEIAAPLIEVTDMVPARWRVRAFPDDAMVARLREREAAI